MHNLDAFVTNFFLTKFSKLRNCLNIYFTECISLKSTFLADDKSKDGHKKAQQSQCQHHLHLHTADVQLLQLVKEFVSKNSHQSIITKYLTYKSLIVNNV